MGKQQKEGSKEANLSHTFQAGQKELGKDHAEKKTKNQMCDCFLSNSTFQH